MGATQQDSSQHEKQKCGSLTSEQDVVKRSRSPVPPTVSSAVSISLHLVSPENGLYSLAALCSNYDSLFKLIYSLQG